jgi:YHS domain-containing protein
MGLFRLLTFILIAIVAWRMIKNYQRATAKKDSSSEKAKISVREKMVKCEICNIHLPKEEAIAGDINGDNNDSEYWFCSPEHKETFKLQDS